jgi:hypothetical protein
VVWPIDPARSSCQYRAIAPGQRRSGMGHHGYMKSQLSGADVMLRTPSKLVRQSVRRGPVSATIVLRGRRLLFGPPAAALPVLPGQPALGLHRPAAAARPLPPEEDVLIVELTEDEDSSLRRCRARRMSPGSRGPVVVDTGVFAARLTPSGSLLAARYRPILEGRPVVISFVTVADLVMAPDWPGGTRENCAAGV